MCTMELVAWLAGEPHSDEPRCACPVLTTLVRAANDLMPDDQREALLRPLAPRLVRSRLDVEAEEARAWIAADAVARFLAALRLDRLDRPDEAATVRMLPRVDGPARAALSAAHLARAGTATHAAVWTLHQAAEERPPTLWIAGVAHVARDADAWGAIPRLIDDMLALRVAAR